MATADTNMAGPLDAHVEIDEVILGGRRPKARKWENKTVVMGMLQRDGRIVAGPVPDQTTYTLEGIVNENVVEGSTISTDGGLNGVYDHGTVNHSAKEYVRGIYHVNNLESHWSLFQRAVKGTHVTSRQNTLGNTSANFHIAATCGTRTGRCSIFLWRLSHCRA